MGLYPFELFLWLQLCCSSSFLFEEATIVLLLFLRNDVPRKFLSYSNVFHLALGKVKFLVFVAFLVT